MNEDRLQKFFNQNKLGLQLESYQSGLFVGSGYDSKFATLVNHKVEEYGIKIDRCFEYFNDYLVTEIFFTNQTDQPIQLNSILVADMIFNAPKANQFEVFENGFLQSSFSGYLKTNQFSRLRKFLSGRDSNSISYKKSFGYIPRSIVSEWYSRILDSSSEDDIVIGALTTDKQFTQIFTKKTGQKIQIRITCQLDGIFIKPGETFKSEKIYIGFDQKHQNLERYADLVAKYMKVKTLKKQIKGLNCSYYSVGNYVDEAMVIKEIDYLMSHQKQLPLEYIQLDAGYSPWGDWLDHTEHFPKGFGWLIETLKANGLKGGIWFSPFTAMKGTKVYEKRQNWMLKDKFGHTIGARRTFPLDWLMPNSFSALDPTHPEVKAYLKKVTQTFVHAYGFSLLKLDFMYAPCMPVYFYKKNITRVQAIREGLAVIREAAGNDTILLSAISPMSPLVGFIDIARVTMDITSPLAYGNSVISRLININLYRVVMRNFKSRSFLNNRLWQNDPDVMVADPRIGFKPNEIKKLMELIRDNKSPIIIGDSLVGLDDQVIKEYIEPLFKKAGQGERT